MLTVPIIFILTLSSCSNQRFILHEHYKMVKKPSYSAHKIFKNWGLDEAQIIHNPKRYCAHNEVLAKIEFKQKNYMIELFSLGYFQPRTVDIYCIDPSL